MSSKIEECKSDYEQLEKDYKYVIKDALKTRQTTNNSEHDLKYLKKEVEQHAIKINAANSFGSGEAWLLRSDEEIYPILTKDKNNHWSKYNNNLKDIKLEGDSLQQLQKFWHTMDTALSSTLNSNKGLGEYDKLTEHYSVKETLVPPQGHTQRNEGQASYNSFTRIICDHLFKKETIEKDTSPKAYICMIKNQLEKMDLRF